ncbi:hypothetical protein ACWCPS_39575 [Streptomyces mauvecolor]
MPTTYRPAFAGVQGAFSSFRLAARRFAIRAAKPGAAPSGRGGSTGFFGGGGVIGG